MTDQLAWLGNKDEVEFAKFKFSGKLAGKSWKYQRNLDGLIRTRIIIFVMAAMVFYPILTNKIYHNHFDPGLMLERTVFSLLLLISGILYNQFRIFSTILALLPVSLILLTYTPLFSDWDLQKVGIMAAIFLLIGAGFYYHFMVKQLRKELESEIPEEIKTARRMLNGEKEYSFLEKVFINWISEKDPKTGHRQIKDFYYQRFFLDYSQKQAEKEQANSYKFNLDNLIEYPKNLALLHEKSNPPFVINFSRAQEIELQVVHPVLFPQLKTADSNSFGFAIHLPFDLEDPERKGELFRFENRSYFQDFASFNEGSMQHYLLNCGTDYQKLEQNLKAVLRDLKNFQDTDQIQIDHWFYRD